MYKENFDVQYGITKGLRSKRRNSPYIFQVVASLPTKAYPNPPCQLSLWEETGAPGEKTPRLSAERWLTLFTWVRSENRTHELRGEMCLSDDCATEAPNHARTSHIFFYFFSVLLGVWRGFAAPHLCPHRQYVPQYDDWKRKSMCDYQV